MLLQYDPEADALYVQFADGHGQLVSRELDRQRYVDEDEDGQVVGVEFLTVSQGIHLDGVPRGDEIARALRSFKATPAA